MIYVDNAATSRKKPLSVVFAAMRELMFSANAGRGGHRASMKTAERIEKTRAIIEECFFRGNVIFTKNCTEALNLGITGINPRGKVITTVLEHNSVLRPLRRLEKEGKIKITYLKPDEKGLIKPLKQSLTKDTVLVILTARSNVTGMPTNAEELAAIVKKETNATILLDCAQSAGHDIIDYKDIDMIAASGHKGLLGPQGTGFLLTKKNIRLSPIITGGTGTASNSLETPIEAPEAFEAGTQNGSGIYALGKGIKYAFANRDKMSNKVNALSLALKKRVEGIENIIVYACYGGIFLCNIRGKDSQTVADLLSNKYRICVRGGLHCAPLMHKFLGTDNLGAIRFSFGDNNNIFQVFYIAKILKRIAHNF